ncbi:MAG TPA: hypothetical protein VHR55_05265 [Candidatus Limnocylindria bacterium]|nr:hypothetical protein [Candidatus Limnocylindria bacterium]
MSLRVVLEVAPKKAFASALDWPGWSRGAKTADEALTALLAYAPRYAEVAKRAKVAFDPPTTPRGVEIVEQLAGGGGTEFGVPSGVATDEQEPLTGADLDRSIALLEAAWATFDHAAKRAEGTPLRLGPRGGGRQIPKIVEHVREAEGGYVHQLGVKVRRDASVTDLRTSFVDALRRLAAGEPFPEPNRVRKPWTARYAVRRSAWHALDHAWEIEDRAEA